MPYKEYVENIWVFSHLKSGADPGFQVRGAHLKTICGKYPDVFTSNVAACVLCMHAKW